MVLKYTIYQPNYTYHLKHEFKLGVGFNLNLCRIVKGFQQYYAIIKVHTTRYVPTLIWNNFLLSLSKTKPMKKTVPN